ncbi:MAG TPA: hypothetical protein PKD55_02490 [Bellilinea sp.]|nr:hypothetical protein [Bellilinea sp.]
MNSIEGHTADEIIIDEIKNFDELPSDVKEVLALDYTPMNVVPKVESTITPPRTVALKKGERLSVNGAEAKVLNFTEQSITVRMDFPIIVVIKGVPMYIHKMQNKRDLVLRVAPEEMLDAIR